MLNFDKIYDEYYDIVFSYIIARVRDESLAEDLAAGLWRRVFEKLHSYDDSKGIMRQWLFGIARNEINMHYRLYYVKKFLSLTDFEESTPSNEKEPAAQAEESELNAKLLNAMAELKSKERDIIALKFYSGLNNREIASLINIGESNVGTIVNRAIAKLRFLLEEV
ncbi:RNA polymerase sigma-70 factor (ECF subfamily) [Elusimicrobium simillimum]|uniref:sigma-70 family RNA polymerase sigma factor n=1 Tax=Elusimicrobium simillimum TaxID=3143438 RepID=UPI003C6F572F